MEWYYCHRSRVDKEVCVPIRLKLIPHPHEQVTELSHILEILEFEECILPSLCDYFT